MTVTRIATPNGSSCHNTSASRFVLPLSRCDEPVGERLPGSASGCRIPSVFLERGVTNTPSGRQQANISRGARQAGRSFGATGALHEDIPHSAAPSIAQSPSARDDARADLRCKPALHRLQVNDWRPSVSGLVALAENASFRKR